MSLINSFMSQVIDLDEKEKEETILFLANATLCNPDHSFLRFISKKVRNLLINFVSAAVEERTKKGGEKMSLEKDLKIIKNAELDIELLGRENDKLCAENNSEIANLRDKIKSTEFILEEELKASGEKKLECKIGYCSFRTMSDKWEYDDEKILLWCKDFKKPYYYTKEIVRRLDLKNDIKLDKLKTEEVPGLTISPQEPKFNYKIK